MLNIWDTRTTRKVCWQIFPRSLVWSGVRPCSDFIVQCIIRPQLVFHWTLNWNLFSVNYIWLSVIAVCNGCIQHQAIFSDDVFFFRFIHHVSGDIAVCFLSKLLSFIPCKIWYIQSRNLCECDCSKLTVYMVHTLYLTM